MVIAFLIRTGMALAAGTMLGPLRVNTQGPYRLPSEAEWE
jgi:hypothetical protein